MRTHIARIATAYLTHTQLPVEQVPILVSTIAETLAELASEPTDPPIDFAVGQMVRLSIQPSKGPRIDPNRRGVITRIGPKHLYVRWDGTRSEAITPRDRIELA